MFDICPCSILLFITPVIRLLWLLAGWAVGELFKAFLPWWWCPHWLILLILHFWFCDDISHKIKTITWVEHRNKCWWGCGSCFTFWSHQTFSRMFLTLQRQCPNLGLNQPIHQALSSWTLANTSLAVSSWVLFDQLWGSTKQLANPWTCCQCTHTATGDSGFFLAEDTGMPLHTWPLEGLLCWNIHLQCKLATFRSKHCKDQSFLWGLFHSLIWALKAMRKLNLLWLFAVEMNGSKLPFCKNAQVMSF